MNSKLIIGASLFLSNGCALSVNEKLDKSLLSVIHSFYNNCQHKNYNSAQDDFKSLNKMLDAQAAQESISVLSHQYQETKEIIISSLLKRALHLGYEPQKIFLPDKE